MADKATYNQDAESSRVQFWRSGLEAVPFLVSIIPFAMIVGALAADKNLTLVQSLLQSAIFFAGASQIVMLDLYGLQTAPWVILLAVFAVNFRMILYSAAFGRKFGSTSRPRMFLMLSLIQDISFALSIKRAQTQSLNLAYVLGNSLVFYFSWVFFTGAGFLLGSAISEPERFGFDMLVPLYFLILVMGFRIKTHFIWIFITSLLTAALVFVVIGSPYHIGSGGLAGMMIAAILAKADRKQVSDA